MNQIWAHKGTCSSESVLRDIHGVVRREGNPQKRKPSPCKHVYFIRCQHILALHVFIDSTCICAISIAPPLTLSPHCCCLVKLFCDTGKLLSLQKSVSIDPPCELALFCLPLCWLSAVVTWSCFLAKYYNVTTVSTHTKFGKSCGEF